jgi:hypothetical protein
MAKFSKKMGGKEVGAAEVYAQPHTMKGKEVNAADAANGYRSEPTRANSVNASVGNVNRFGYDAEPKKTGIKIRGTGCATKGTMARGPMA